MAMLLRNVFAFLRKRGCRCFCCLVFLFVMARESLAASLFHDDFNGGIPGWTAVQPPGNFAAGPMRWEYDIISNAFTEQSNIYSDSATYSTSANAVMLINDAVASNQFTLTARLTAGDDDGFGLIFGYQNETNFFRASFARQQRDGFPWTGWNVDRKVNGGTTNLFGDGTAGHVGSFTNTAGQPFDVTLSVDASNRLTLVVVKNPAGAATTYPLVSNGILPGVAGGRVGLMSWGMQGGTPKSFRIADVSLSPDPLVGNPNGLPNWTAVVPPNAAGTKVLTGNGGQALWSLSEEREGATGWLSEGSDAFGNATTNNLDFVAPSLVAGDTNWVNYTVWTRMIPRDNDGHGILLRYRNDTNFYRISLASEATATGRPPQGLAVQKNVNRAWTDVFREAIPQYAPATDMPYDLVAQISTNRLRILLAADPTNTGQIFTYGPIDITGATIVSGKVGIFSWGQTRTDFDFVEVQDGTPLYIASPHNSVTPLPGLHTYSSGASVTAMATPLASSGTRHAALGWTGTGSVPATGTGSNVTFNLSTLSSLRWNWRTEFQVTASAGTGGTVNASGEWFELGTEVTLVAVPDPGYLFVSWLGDISSATNSLKFAVDRPVTLTAIFSVDSDGDGLPDNWEIIYFGNLLQGAEDDFDHDARSNAKELQLGSHPLVADLLRVAGAAVRGDLTSLDITNTTGTRYAVQMTTNLPGPWQTIASNQFTTNFSAPVPAGDRAFYRLSQPSPAPEVPPFIPGSWTLAVLPDTQIYSQTYPEIFQDQTRWIAANKERYNIQYVFHLGDIVNVNVPSQWTNAQRALSMLDGVVPYALVPGNHDYNGGATNRSTLLNQFFPISKFESWPTFGGAMQAGKMENTYHLFSAGGVDWLVVALEWGPRNSTVAWADQIISQHPNRKVFLITHAFTYFDDTRYDWNAKGTSQSWNPHSYATANDPDGTNDGEDMWQKFVRKHPNFVMALNGHVLGDGLGRLTTPGDYGNHIHQILVNYQMQPLGGEGYLRLIEFLPDGKTLQFKSYSPYYGTYKIDPQNQFTLTLNPPLSGSGGE